jgi:cobalt-zinc-cadmium efflux system membrane fusion protein
MTRRSLLFATVILGGVIALAIWWFGFGVTPSSTTPPALEPRALITAATAAHRPLAPVLEVYGAVAADPSSITTVAAPRDIKIDRVLVRPGDAVSAGAPLLKVSTQPGALSQLRQAESAVTLAQAETGRLRRLRAAGLAANDQVATAEKSLSDAKAQLGALRAVGTDQATSDLVAPSAGIVLTITSGEGNAVPAGTSVVTLATKNALLVTAGLEAEDAVRAKPGLKARLQSPLDRTLDIGAVVVSVGRAVDPVTRLVNATLRAEIADALIPGMSLSVRIVLPEQSGVVVPRAAILEDADGLHAFIIRDGVARRRRVELVFETDSEALVKSGISPGDKVAVSGVSVLHDGVAVREPKS